MPLSDTERRIVAAIGRTFFPRGGALEWDADDVHSVEYVEDYLSRLPTFDRLSLKALLRAFDAGYVIETNAPGRRFVDADPEEQLEYLNSWEHSPIYQKRMLWQALRIVFSFAYADADPIREATGATEPFVPRTSPPA